MLEAILFGKRLPSLDVPVLATQFSLYTATP